MNVSGDPHNFGQRVTRAVGASGAYFQKPRPVYWEWLFFGKSSPLLPILLKYEKKENVSRDLSQALSRAIFALDVTFEDPGRGGTSKELCHQGRSYDPTDSELRGFGSLLAYSYVFGIRDLHKGNLVRGSSYLHVVDAEVVLAKLTLPNETLLLPLKDVSFDRSGIGALFAARELVTAEHLVQILTGFTSAFLTLEAAAPELALCVKQALEAHGAVGIRHILRDTARYRQAMSGSDASDLLPEEQEQVSRGDVPYFTKFLGSNALYYQCSPSGDLRAVQVPERFAEAVAREAVDPAVLLDQRRIRELFATGTLYLARTLAPRDSNSALELKSGLEISFSGETVSLQSPWGAFSSNRHRRPS